MTACCALCLRTIPERRSCTEKRISAICSASTGRNSFAPRRRFAHEISGRLQRQGRQSRICPAGRRAGRGASRARRLPYVLRLLRKIEGRKAWSLCTATSKLPLSDVLFAMEESGVKIDTAMSEQFEKRYREEIRAITERIFRAAGETFNLNSPAHSWARSCLKSSRSPAPKKSKKGTYSTSADVLEKLQDDYAIVRDVLRCRHFQKLLLDLYRRLQAAHRPENASRPHDL